jgi:hypothetical protein
MNVLKTFDSSLCQNLLVPRKKPNCVSRYTFPSLPPLHSKNRIENMARSNCSFATRMLTGRISAKSQLHVQANKIVFSFSLHGTQCNDDGGSANARMSFAPFGKYNLAPLGVVAIQELHFTLYSSGGPLVVLLSYKWFPLLW